MAVNPSPQVDSPRAWLIVLAAFLGAFVTFGVTYTFGVFLRPLSREFHVSHASMTLLFSVIAAISFFVPPFTGELADRYGPRVVVGAGAVLMAISLILAGRTQSFTGLLLTYGVGFGFASACVYVPGVSAVGEWFKRRRDIALGIAISGIGCGTLVAAPLSAALINRYGWRASFNIFGWASGALLLMVAALLSPPPELREKAKVAISHKVRTGAFLLLYLGIMLAGVAIFTAFVFIPVFATEIGLSRVAGAAVVGYVGAASVIGRLGLNALAVRFGLFRMYQIAYAILMASFALWLIAHSYLLMVLFGIAMGVGYGGIAAMAPAVTAEVFGVEGLGELLGILFTAFGVASIVGPPLAGTLMDRTHNYHWPVALAAAAAVFALFSSIPLSGFCEREEVEEQRAAGAA